MGGAGAHHFNNISHLANKVTKAIKSVGRNCFCGSRSIQCHKFLIKMSECDHCDRSYGTCNKMLQNDAKLMRQQQIH